MRDFVYGQDVLIEAKKDGVYRPFACAIEVSLEIVSELLPSSSADTGTWECYRPSHKNGWTASVSGVVVLEDATDVLWFPQETFLEQIRNSGMDIRFTFTDKKGTIKTWSGFAYIPSSGLSGVPEEFANYNIKFQGSGKVDVTTIVPPPNPNSNDVERIEWITTGAEGNKVYSNKLIGINKAALLVVSREGDDKYQVLDAGDPNAKQVRLDAGEGSLRFLIPMEANEFVYCVKKI